LDDDNHFDLLASLKRQIAQRERAVVLNNSFLAVGLHVLFLLYLSRLYRAMIGEIVSLLIMVVSMGCVMPPAI
jgi:hypothetical protein